MKTTYITHAEDQNVQVSDAIAARVKTLKGSKAWATKSYDDRKWYRLHKDQVVHFAGGEFTDHTDARVQAAVKELRAEFGNAASYKVIAVAMGFQCDHWSQAASYAKDSKKADKADSKVKAAA